MSNDITSAFAQFSVIVVIITLTKMKTIVNLVIDICLANEMETLF